MYLLVISLMFQLQYIVIMSTKATTSQTICTLLMNDKLERMWTQSWSILRWYVSIFLEGIKEIIEVPKLFDSFKQLIITVTAVVSMRDTFVCAAKYELWIYPYLILCGVAGVLPSGDTLGQFFIWSSSKVFELDEARASRDVSSIGIFSITSEPRVCEWSNTTVNAEMNDCWSKSRNTGRAELMNASVLREQFTSWRDKSL